MTVEDLNGRARALAAALAGIAGLTCEVIDGDSTIGGGSAPASALPTRLVALRSARVSSTALAERLRQGQPAVVGRIVDTGVVLDPRTMADDDTAGLVTVVAGAIG